MVMSNAGNSVLTLRFYQAADSPILNKRADDIIPLGIYAGGYLTRINDSEVSVSPLVCEIQDKTGDHDQIRAQTTAAITVTGVSSSTPYIVLRWTYTGVVDTDFLELVAVATPDDYELVVGKADYVGSVMQTTFNYGSSTTTKRSTPRTMETFCKVEPEQTPSMYVRIREGVVQIGNNKVVIYDQLSSVFTAPGSGSKTGAVYINDSGAVLCSSDFTYAGQIVLAEIALTAGQTQITADEITDTRPFLTAPLLPDDESITRNSDGLLELKAPYVKIHDNRTAGTDGGTATAGAWRTHRISAIMIDTHGIASLDGVNYRVTLPAGTYRCKATAAFYETNGTRIKLRNISDSSDVDVSINAWADWQYGGGCNPVLYTQFTITATKTFELQYFCTNSMVTYGLGHSMSASGVNEVYAVLEFWKIK